MNNSKVTPKDFFLWAGAVLSLYISVFAFVELIFAYINKLLPDPLDYQYDMYGDSVRYPIAILIILVPLFLVLINMIRSDIAKLSAKADLWIRRWALYLTVFLAGSTLAVDLIVLIYSFLGGDYSTRFFLKVLTVLIVASAVFAHFIADIRGYWLSHRKYTHYIASGVSILVVLSIVASIFVIGTPSQIRLYRFDDQKVSDLQSIQSQIVYVWQSKGKLPSDLESLNDTISGYIVPIDPQSDEDYVYQITDKMSFKLCAVFNSKTADDINGKYIGRAYPTVSSEIDMGNMSWTHDAGEQCFDRVIDPELYPVFKDTLPIR